MLNEALGLANHIYERQLVIYCDTPAEIEVSFRTDGRWRTEGQTDVEVEIVV